MSTSRLPTGPWCAFGASLVSALGTIVTGTLAATQPSFHWAFIMIYCCFILTFSAFVYMCIDNWNDLISPRCLYYFVAMVSTILTLATILGPQSQVLHLYIPISCNMGIYAALGLEHIWSQLTSIRVRRCLISCLTPRPQGLPRHEPRSTQSQRTTLIDTLPDPTTSIPLPPPNLTNQPPQDQPSILQNHTTSQTLTSQ